MNQQIRTIAALDRVIHEPGRLALASLLYAVDSSDFLYLQHETGMNKGTLSTIFRVWKNPGTSRSLRPTGARCRRPCSAHARRTQGLRAVS